MKVRNIATGVILESDNDLMIATWVDNPDFEPVDDFDLDLFDDGDDNAETDGEDVPAATGDGDNAPANEETTNSAPAPVPKSELDKKKTCKGKEAVTNAEESNLEKGAGSN